MARIGNSWNPFDTYGRGSMKRRGEQDGAAGIPLRGSDQLPPAQSDLRAAGVHDLGIIERDFVEADERLHATYRNAVAEHRQAQSDFDRVEAEHETARERYQDHHGEVAPRTTSRTHRAYWFAFGVLGVIELPVNKAAFAILRDNVLLTWAAAAGVGMILLGSAHVVGGLVRNVRQWTWNRAAVALSLLVGVASTVYATAVLRRAFLLVHGGEGLDPDTAFWVFAAINSGLFFLGAALSYRVHRKWSGEVARTGRIVVRARKRLEAAEKAAERARTRRGQAFGVAQACGHILQQAINWRAEVYREANLRARTDFNAESYPASYTTPLAFDWPDALLELTWDDPAETVDEAEDVAPDDGTIESDETPGEIEIHEPSGDGLAGTPEPDLDAPKT